nr:hypothetical protein [Tanacetum cinerariifolium]
FLVGSLLWGSSGVSSGSGVEVVDWSRKWGRGGNGAGGKTDRVLQYPLFKRGR